MAALRRPVKLLHWILLLTPAASMILGPIAVRPFRGLVSQVGLLQEDLLIANLLVATLFCFGLGLWAAWPAEEWHQRLFLGFFAGMGLVIINGAIAVAGCSTMLNHL